MWISRKLNDTGMNQATTTDQKSSMLVMNLMMPLMSLWIAFIAPAAVGLYWVYTSLLGILQTVLLAKIMPLPRYTEEEIRMIQKEMKGKNGQQARTIVGTSVDENGKPKSLHYTDDDDEY
jgi:YidC/Oxa1 family membrane protein insertase